MNNIELKTERLLIKPLTPAQLLLYLRNNGGLEKELGVRPCERIISTELKEALETVLIPMVTDLHNYPLFATLWTIIDTDKNRMVGDACFKGKPNKRGQVEIGYGTYTGFENKGYATEAVKALANWALAQSGVSGVLAETEDSNAASHRTLIKAGFEKYSQKDSMLWWRKESAMPSPFSSSMKQGKTSGTKGR